jgi:diacylglycerol O-acyltransferase / wax synthase
MGRELLAVFPMVPLAKRQAVCFGIMSYNGQVNFGLVGDFEAMGDLDALARDLEASIGELADAAPTEKKPSRRRQPETDKQAAKAQT